jgi:hypothetical protein
MLLMSKHKHFDANTLAIHSIHSRRFLFSAVSPKVVGCGGLNKIAKQSDSFMSSAVFRSVAEDGASFLLFNFKATVLHLLVP